MRYFFYGSLTDPDVLALVLGRPRARAVPAVLRGWRRWRVAGEAYPLIAPAPGERVEGVAVDVAPAETRRLAWYEGDDYEPRELEVELAGGARAAAWVFVPKPNLAHAGELWDPAVWAREHKAELLAAARCWMAFEGRRPANLDVAWRVARRAPARRKRLR